MENILKLGGKEFKIEINFKKSYDLTKYRNKITMGFDFSNADKNVVEEILKASSEQAEGKELDVSKLSPEALMFLKSKSETTVFSYEEIVDIVKILTSLENEEEIVGLLDEELKESDFDSVIAKIVNAVSIVFTSAKGTSK